MSVMMFLMAFGVQEMAVGRLQVAKQCLDKFLRVLPLLPFLSYGASKFANNHPDFTQSCLIVYNAMPTYRT